MHFAALCTAVFWGCYGPTLAVARGHLNSPWKPYVAIGIAYLVSAVLCGLIAMWITGEPMSFSGVGFKWGFIAGTLGALGALALTISMVNGGGKTPQVIMAIVFGGAVVVSAMIATMQMPDDYHTPAGLWIGIFLVAAGIIFVTKNTPHPKPAKPVVKIQVGQPT